MQLISTNLLPVQVAGSNSDSNKQYARFGLKYCPSMDLVAVFPKVITYDHHEKTEVESPAYADIYAEDDEGLPVDVYRLSGQKVFTINIDDENGIIGICDVAWRDDGVILAIATSDNKTRLVNSFSGKVVHTFTLLTESTTLASTVAAVPPSPSGKRKSSSKDLAPKKRRCTPTSLHYSTYFSDLDGRHKLHTAERESGVTIDSLLGLNANIDDLLKLSADLPRELANIDVESFLPRLSTLPPTGAGGDDVFSTRTSVDAIFHATKQNARFISIDVLAVAQDDSHLHIRIFDSFEIGDIDLNHALDTPPGTTFGPIKSIATHPFLGRIYCITEEHDDGSTAKHTRSHGVAETRDTPLHLLSLDLRFLQQSKLALPMLATKATQLHNLTRYLRQIETQLAREVKTAFDLPVRFIRNLDEDLKEQDGDGSTFATSAHHTILTGEVHGKFKEWLVEQLGDRGVKRWEKAVSECLDLVRRLISENWNPAVERVGLVVSRLNGLVAADSSFGIDKQVIAGLRDTADVMAILGEELLKELGTEMVEFDAFMKWLKREVEMAGLEDTSEKLDELREGSDHTEVRKVIRYISQRLHDTSVKKYIRDDTPDSTYRRDDKDLDFYSNYKEARQNGKKDLSPALKPLVSRLAAQCNQLFQQVARQMRENVLVQHIRQLKRDNYSGSNLDSEILDSRITWKTGGPVLHAIGKDKNMRNRLVHIKQQLEPDTIQNAFSDFDDDMEVLDVKIADDEQAMILIGNATKMSIVGFNMLQSTPELIVRHTFNNAADEFIKAGLRPWKLEINGRKGRRTLTVLDEQGRGYAVYDLDSTEDNSGVDGTSR